MALLAAVAASIIDGGGDCDPCRSDVRRAPETEPADLRRALRAVPDDDPDRLVIAVLAAHDSWDDDAWSLLADRLVRLARADGALALLPLALTQRTLAHLHAGEFTAAAALAAETAAIGAATGDVRPACANVVLTCWRGRPVIDDAARQATALGEGRGLQLVRQAAAVLHNGLGHYAEALTASAGAGQSGLPELVEAAARSGEPERAAEAVRRLSRSAGESGTAWARGIEARSRALISDGDDADKLYREAIDLLTTGRGDRKSVV